MLRIEDAAEAVAEGETGATASRTLARAVADWPMVRATLQRNGASPMALVKVDGTIVAVRNDLRQHRDFMRDANEVTGALAPLFPTVGERVPASVHELDYLGRSVALDVAVRDWQRAHREAASVATHWANLRPVVEARRHGRTAARQFDRAVKAIVAASDARNARATRAASTSITDAVDTVEKVFE